MVIHFTFVTPLPPPGPGVSVAVAFARPASNPSPDNGDADGMRRAVTHDRLRTRAETDWVRRLRGNCSTCTLTRPLWAELPLPLQRDVQPDVEHEPCGVVVGVLLDGHRVRRRACRSPRRPSYRWEGRRRGRRPERATECASCGNFLLVNQGRGTAVYLQNHYPGVAAVPDRTQTHMDQTCGLAQTGIMPGQRAENASSEELPRIGRPARVIQCVGRELRPHLKRRNPPDRSAASRPARRRPGAARPAQARRPR